MEDIQHDDPYNWSVDQVVEALCKPDSPFLRSYPRTNLPDLTSLEASLRDNDVDGTTLLTGINGPELRDDLGLKVLRQRTTILNAIRALRVRSAKYQDNAPGMGLPTLDLQRFTTPFSRQTSVAERHFPILQSPAQQSRYERSASVASVVTPTTLNGFTVPFREVVISSSSYDEILPSAVDTTKTPNTTLDSERRLLHTPDSATGMGRTTSKRQASEPDRPDGDVPLPNGKEMIGSSSAAANGVLIVEGGKKRRRVEPQPVVDPEELKPNPFIASHVDPKMIEPQPMADSSKAILAESIFFPSHEENDSDLEKFAFLPNHSHSYEDPKAWYGARVYLNRRVKHFLRQPKIDLGVHERKQCTAVVPYPHRLVRKPDPHYVKIYVREKGNVIVRKDQLYEWPDLEAEHQIPLKARSKGFEVFKEAIQFDRDMIESAAPANPFVDPVADEEVYWARLEQHFGAAVQSDDEANALPKFGDSDSEDVYDSEEDRSMKEIAQAPPKPKQLSKEEVVKAVDEAIETRAENWRSENLPLLGRKAWKVWTRSRRDNSVKAQINGVRRQLALAETRIVKFRTPLENDSWFAVKEVHKACGTLHVSVEDREEALWKIHVLELRKAPSKPPPMPKTERIAKAPSKPLDLADDEEELEKESVASSGSDMDDFLIEDRPVIKPASSTPVATDTDAVDVDASNFADVEDAMDIEEPLDVEDAPNVEDAVEVDGKDRHTPESEEDDNSDDEIIGSQTRRQRQRKFILSHVEIGADSKNNLSIHSPRHIDGPSKSNSQLLRLMTPLKQNSTSIIDLTISSQESNKESRRSESPSSSIGVKNERGEDSAFQIKPPRLRVTIKAQAPSAFRKPPYGWLVDPSTSGENTPTSSLDSSYFLEVKGMNYDELERTKDRRRLVYKLILDMPIQRREALINVIPKMVIKSTFRVNVFAALQALERNEKGTEGLSPGSNTGCMAAAVLWISWVSCESLREQEKSGISLRLINGALNYGGFDGYVSFLVSILKSINPVVIDSSPEKGKTKSLRGTIFEHETSTEDSLEYRSTPEQAPLELTPHKKRKNEVKVDKKAREARLDDQRRAKDSQRAQDLFMKQLIKEGVSNDDPDHQAVSFRDPANVIFLHPDIGRLVKPHQLRGIQFMWRELVQDDKRQGCLLAHTMGLGKTMQVISVLVTIAIGLQSTDPAIRKQLPQPWKRPNTLILCPPGLVDNWLDELAMWTPKPIKDFLINIYCVRSEVSLGRAAVPSNLARIAEWHEKGGVLVMSYEYFRILALNKSTNTRDAPLTPTQYAKLEKDLLKGPDIIVADEAHKLKRLTTGISQAAALFRSKSRIALTGSPLANHLEEYYAMINWIAPGYLGNAVEFRSKYVEPIKDGLYADSTSYEKRRAVTKLSILNKNLDPKINRADVTCMRDELPSKTEFVITVTLTKVQERAYNIFIGAQKHDVSQTRLFDWLHMLGLVCNHPQCFKDGLESHETVKTKRTKALGDSRQNNYDDDTSAASDDDMTSLTEPSASGMSKELVTELLSYLESVDDLENASMSHRTRILRHIIHESIKADDKLLIFSHSLHTLDYLQEMLNDEEISCDRLDGGTIMASRQGTAKSFNQAGSGTSVFLISTKAGGLGLNLYGANRVVIFDYGFNPTLEEQAVGRAYRLGQKKAVFVYRFKAGGTFEDVIEMKTIFKTQLASRVVDKKNPIRFATKNAKDYLFPPKEVEQKDLEEFRGKDPKVLDKILSRKLSCIKALDLTETFHIEEDEKLTAEEEKEVRLELYGEELKRNDPQKYDRWLIERQNKEMAKRAAQAQNNAVRAGLNATKGVSTRFEERPLPPPRPRVQKLIPSSHSLATLQSSQSTFRESSAAPATIPASLPSSYSILPPNLPTSSMVQLTSHQNPPGYIPSTASSVGTPTFPSTPKLHQVPTSSASKAREKDMSRAKVGAAVEDVQQIHSLPLPDEKDGMENSSRPTDGAEATGDRAELQEQLNRFSESTSMAAYNPEQSEIQNNTRIAVEPAFAANSNNIQSPPAAGDSELKKAISGLTKVWKGHSVEALNRTKYRGRSRETEKSQMLANGLEIDWLAKKGWAAHKEQERNEEARGIDVLDEGPTNIDPSSQEPLADARDRGGVSEQGIGKAAPDVAV